MYRNNNIKLYSVSLISGNIVSYEYEYIGYLIWIEDRKDFFWKRILKWFLKESKN